MRCTRTAPSIPQAFEEALRWEPPVTVILRRATRDTELAGVKIEQGADIGLMIGAANRDERKYVDPDRYDMFRQQRQHVGFGFGVHVCLGMHLARMESRVAMNTLFDRLGRFTLDPDADVPAHRGHGLPLAPVPAGGVRGPLSSGKSPRRARAATARARLRVMGARGAIGATTGEVATATQGADREPGVVRDPHRRRTLHGFRQLPVLGPRNVRPGRCRVCRGSRHGLHRRGADPDRRARVPGRGHLLVARRRRGTDWRTRSDAHRRHGRARVAAPDRPTLADGPLPAHRAPGGGRGRAGADRPPPGVREDGGAGLAGAPSARGVRGPGLHPGRDGGRPRGARARALPRTGAPDTAGLSGPLGRLSPAAAGGPMPPGSARCSRAWPTAR